MRQFVLFVVVAVLAGGGSATAAQADRAPSKSERAGVAKAIGAPARCVRVRVSTVDDRYASAHMRNRRQSCRQADGVAVFRRGAAGWRFVTAGSSFDCPVPKVPARVARDLGIRCIRT